MKKFTILLVIIISLLTSKIVFSQTIPHTINYQGILKDASGVVVTNGDFELTFRLYDVETNGSALWTETKTLTVTDGIVNTLLGSSTPIDLSFNKEYWLEIKVGTESELTPRIKLSAVPYSYMSMNVVDGSITADKIKSGEVVKSINTLTDDVTLVAGSNVSITPSGDNLTISSTASGGGLTLPFDGTVNEPNTIGIKITHNGSIGTNYGFFGKLTSGNGAGIQGEAPFYGVVGNSTTSAGEIAYGVWGLSASPLGTGVYGHATNTTGNNYGVYGRSSSSIGYGVYGEGYRGVVGYTSSSVAFSYGVMGKSNSTTGSSYGVYGESASSTGIGIYGKSEYIGVSGTATSTDAGITYGVRGESISTQGFGVSGYNSADNGSTCGVWGGVNSNGGIAVKGNSYSTTGGTGIMGQVHSTDGYSGYFTGGKFFVSGNVGIGTASPSYKFDVAGNINLNKGLTGIALRCNGDEAIWYDGTYFSWGYAGSYNFFGNKLKIGGNGNVAPAYTLYVDGTAAKSSAGTAWIVSSDERLKNILGNYDKGLNEIVELQPIKFRYKENNPRNLPTENEEVGFIAQDIQKVFPEAVTKAEDGYLDFNIHSINVSLVNAVKQLKAENDELKARLEKLENYISQTSMK